MKDLISASSKILRYKISIKENKPRAFIYTNSVLSEEEIRKQNPFKKIPKKGQ